MHARWDKVRTFWETHKIWKNLPHGFDKSANLLSQNHEEDFLKYVCFSKSPNFNAICIYRLGLDYKKYIERIFWGLSTLADLIKENLKRYSTIEE